MFGVILKATNSSFQKGMAFCCSIYVKKVMKLLAFIFEQPSYCHISKERCGHYTKSLDFSIDLKFLRAKVLKGCVLLLLTLLSKIQQYRTLPVLMTSGQPKNCIY